MNTFGAVAEDLSEAALFAKLRQRTEVASVIRRELVPKWSDRPIVELTRRDVVILLEEVRTSGRPYTAHHLLARICQKCSTGRSRGTCTSVRCITNYAWAG